MYSKLMQILRRRCWRCYRKINHISKHSLIFMRNTWRLV